MNKCFPISYRPVVLTALALLCGSLAALPAGAQMAVPATDKPVTLNLQNVPVQTALRSLFHSAGISNYAFDTPAQGFVNMQVSDVPFSVALRQVLRSVQPALDFTTDSGTYHITSKSSAAEPVAAPSPSAQAPRISGAGTVGTGSSTTDQMRRFYPIHINKYDAFVIASLLGSAGIVDVPPNITRGSNTTGGQQGGFGGGQQNGFGGQQNGFGGGQQGGFGGGNGRRRGGGGGRGFGGGYGG